MISCKRSEQPSRSGSAGWSLINLVLTVLMVSVLAAVSLEYLGTTQDGEKYEATRQQMQNIQNAILGDVTVNNQGHRLNFGYVGDWGSLPSALSNLTTAQAPAYAFNATYGFGSGWKGPYLQGKLATADPTKDAWLNSYVWAPTAATPSLTSYGADGVAGGTAYNTDLVQNIPTTMWLATVSGTLYNGTTAVSGATVEIRYPVLGTITAFTTATSATGTFSFANVPFGVRSLRVTSGTALGPVQIIVDNYQYEAHLAY